MAEYRPELGQMVTGVRWAPHACPEYAAALVEGILWRIGLECWNRDQAEWSRETDPGISGIIFRPYWWGDDDDEQAALPNLECCGLTLRWYKWPGRGMTIEEDWTPARWAEWFAAAARLIEQAAQTREGERQP